jgi:hypothetical protein
MVISAGKMSGLWSGSPNTIRLDELDVICAVLGCGVEELLLPKPGKVPQSAPEGTRQPIFAGDISVKTSPRDCAYHSRHAQPQASLSPLKKPLGSELETIRDKSARGSGGLEGS